MLNLEIFHAAAQTMIDNGLDRVELGHGRYGVLLSVYDRHPREPAPPIRPQVTVARDAQVVPASAPAPEPAPAAAASVTAPAAREPQPHTVVPSVSDVQELGRKVITAKGRPAFDEVMKATGKSKVGELDDNERVMVFGTLLKILTPEA